MKERRKVVKTPLRPTVKTPVRPKVPGLVIQGNRIVGVQPKAEIVKPDLYNPMIHRPGDRVLIQAPHSKRLVETVIPRLDADGQPIYEQG